MVWGENYFDCSSKFEPTIKAQLGREGMEAKAKQGKSSSGSVGVGKGQCYRWDKEGGDE